MQFLFAALVFVIIFLIFGGVWALVGQEKQSDIIRTRLDSIDKGAAFAKNALKLELIRDELLSSIPAFNSILKRWTWPGRLRDFIAQAGMQVRPGKVMLVSVAIALTTFECVVIWYNNPLMGVIAGIPAGLVPLVAIAIKRLRRLRAFERNFPEVIDLLSRSVRAGHSFTSGMEIVATDLPEPVATEFRITFDEQRFGLPLRDALLNLSHRIPLIDVRLFVIALLVQKETGGNLVEILDKLAHVIRERFRIAGEVRIRTAQGRLTAILLICLPVVVGFLLNSMDPGYLKVLFTDRLGQMLLAGSAILQVIGAFIIWRIVDIKV